MEPDDTLGAAGLPDLAGAVRIVQRGHFTYESGLHGDTWFDLDGLFAEPARVRLAASRLAERLAPYGATAVCAPYAGGALVGLLVAEALGLPFAPASPAGREPDGAAREPDAAGRERDGVARYALSAAAARVFAGARVAIVDDAVNAGSATLACARAVDAAGGAAVVAGALIARAPGADERLAAAGLPLEFLVGLPFDAWEPAACPLCRAGRPLESEPG
jgi:orotate phosphoribosyltransferase